jgi:hypothetical protein
MLLVKETKLLPDMPAAEAFTSSPGRQHIYR